MAVLAYIVAALYFLIAVNVVPRLVAAAQAAPGLLQAARWGASAFFAGCAVTHIVIGTAALRAAVHGTSTGMTGMTGMTADPSSGAILLGHVIPHIAQIAGGLTFILIARRRLEWTVLSKDAAEGFRQRELQFRTAFERAPVGIALVSLAEQDAGQILQANPALAALAGMSVGDTPRSYQQLIAPSGSDAAAQDLDLLRARQPIVNRERRLVHADDPAIWVNVSASVVNDEHELGAAFAVV